MLGDILSDYIESDKSKRGVSQCALVGLVRLAGRKTGMELVQ